MKSTDSSSALRSLDRLPPEEARDFESRLAGDPALAANLREWEDTVTAIWHAASPLVPAPAGSLDAVRAGLHPVRSRRGLGVFLAATGWAAALVLAILLMNRPQTRPIAKISSVPEKVALSPAPVGAPAARDSRHETEPDGKLHETIRRLQSELAASHSRGAGPRIRELRPPGAAGRPGDQARALNALLAAALAEHLARQSESPAALTVENGWLDSIFAALPPGSVIRHRSFPAENYGQYQLLRSDDGEFYDPASNLIWSPAEDGGGYLGHVAEAGFDHSAFQSADPLSSPEPDPPLDKSSPSPSGYLVQISDGGDATIIIGNLPLNGNLPQLVASTDGGRTTIPLSGSQVWPGGDGTGFASFSIPNSVINTSVNSGFSILQPNENGTSTVILIGAP